MDIISVSNDESFSSRAIIFFNSIKYFSFKFKTIDEIYNTNNSKILVFISPNINIRNFKNFFYKINKNKNNEYCFLLPHHFNAPFLQKLTKIIHYPLSIDIFEKKLSEIFREDNFIYKNLLINNKNLLLNTQTKKSIYLTELESDILKFFFKSTTVYKEEIKIQILKMHPAAESKSLDSHLYRIRKKLFSISKNITIFSVNKNTLKIKFSTATKDLLD